MKVPEVKRFKIRHRIISFIRDFDIRGLRRLSVMLPKILLPDPGSQKEFILETDMGFQMIIDPSTDRGVELSLYETGTYEKGILHIIATHLKKDGTFIDVGANIGLMSLFVAEKFPQATVHAFEAHPDNFRRLEANVQLNSFNNIVLHQMALGDNKEMVMIADDEESNRGGAKISDSEGSTSHHVQMDRLDDVLMNTAVSMIKIDVEGYEFEVLKGSENLIRANKPILIVEVSRNRGEADLAPEIFRFIKSLESYSIYKLKGGKERKSVLVEIKDESSLPEHDNIICIA